MLESTLTLFKPPPPSNYEIRYKKALELFSFWDQSACGWAHWISMKKSEYHEKFYLTMYSSEENTGNDKVGCYGVLYAFNLNTYGR